MGMSVSRFASGINIINKARDLYNIILEDLHQKEEPMQ